jgi:DNA-binding NtrC family response regulator
MLDGEAYGRKVALVVEEDEEQRAIVSCLMEESDLRVVECATADAAFAVMQQMGPQVAVVFTCERLPGVRTGVDLAFEVTRGWPGTDVILTSSAAPERPLPPGVCYLPKPWRALDILTRVA